MRSNLVHTTAFALILTAALARSQQPASSPVPGLPATPRTRIAQTALASAQPQWVLPAMRAPRVQRRTFDSAVANTAVSYFLYTPPAYDTDAQRRLPVLYWLHGSGGGSAGVPQLAGHFDAAIRSGKIPPMLVVFPNGLPMSMWCDWKDGSVPMETIVIQELLPHIDATFRTIATREGRIIEGFSMGGYGAARLGFKHHQLFAAVSMLGAGPLQLDFTEAPRAGPRGRDQVLQTVFGGDLEQFKAQSPWRMAEQNAAAVRAGTRVRQIIGDRDETLRFNRDFHEHLTKLEIPHSFTVLPGIPHDPVAVLKALGETNWEFYRAAFGPIGAATSLDRPQAIANEPSAAGDEAQTGAKHAVAPNSPSIQAFQLTGEHWTCTADGKPMSGVLLRPAGDGPFPAVILSHGLGGNAQTMATVKGREMVKWGFVCIATDYTHAGNPGGGRRGTADVDFTQAGARPENIRRALACVEILRQQPDVDPHRIAAYGHSMGAFVTIALAAAAPDKLAAAAITSGGVQTTKTSTTAAPNTNVAAQVRVPFLILQGATDTTVPPESSALFQQVLDQNQVPNQRIVFEGVGHNVLNEENADEIYRLMRIWFAKHGTLPTVERKQPKR